MEWVSTVPQLIQELNTIFWVATNILVAYTMGILIVFVVLYYALFDPRATTAGKFVFRFMLALVGVTSLSIIGIFLDPSRGQNWSQIPIDTLPWRPFIRMLVYGYVAYAITGLAVLIVIRKWWPEKIRTAKTRDLLKTRR